MLPDSEGSAAAARARRKEELDHGSPTRTIAGAANSRARRLGRCERIDQDQPASGMDERRGLGLCQSARRPVQRAARSRISEHRLRAVHKSRSARRRQPGRTLVVGGHFKRMRAASAQDSEIINEEWTHLRELESESIYILRETVAQF